METIKHCTKKINKLNEETEKCELQSTFVSWVTKKRLEWKAKKLQKEVTELSSKCQKASYHFGKAYVVCDKLNLC
jgi:hypothetical protein